jgi:hypothetical protein
VTPVMRPAIIMGRLMTKDFIAHSPKHAPGNMRYTLVTQIMTDQLNRSPGPLLSDLNRGHLAATREAPPRQSMGTQLGNAVGRVPGLKEFYHPTI